jgi:hypothetical protein
MAKFGWRTHVDQRKLSHKGTFDTINSCWGIGSDGETAEF